jgi:hypothetical protein
VIAIAGPSLPGSNLTHRPSAVPQTAIIAAYLGDDQLPADYIGRPGLASRNRVPVSASWRNRRRCPALAILLVPLLDLAIDLGDADAAGPIHQPAAVAREAETVELHHIAIGTFEQL